jgi:hypothetical protein
MKHNCIALPKKERYKLSHTPQNLPILSIQRKRKKKSQSVKKEGQAKESEKEKVRPL